MDDEVLDFADHELFGPPEPPPRILAESRARAALSANWMRDASPRGRYTITFRAGSGRAGTGRAADVVAAVCRFPVSNVTASIDEDPRSVTLNCTHEVFQDVKLAVKGSAVWDTRARFQAI